MVIRKWATEHRPQTTDDDRQNSRITARHFLFFRSPSLYNNNHRINPISTRYIDIQQQFIVTFEEPLARIMKIKSNSETFRDYSESIYRFMYIMFVQFTFCIANVCAYKFTMKFVFWK